jgi:hypothetical protein
MSTADTMYSDKTSITLLWMQQTSNFNEIDTVAVKKT